MILRFDVREDCYRTKAIKGDAVRRRIFQRYVIWLILAMVDTEVVQGVMCAGFLEGHEKCHEIRRSRGSMKTNRKVLDFRDAEMTEEPPDRGQRIRSKVNIMERIIEA